MKCLKRMSTFVLLFISLFLFTGKVNAASSEISVSSNKSSVIVGNTFNVSVTVSTSGDKLGSWQYTLSYDSSLFKVTSGNTTIVDYGDGNKSSATYNYTFKAIASGSGTISVKSYDVVGWNSESSLSPSVSSSSVKIMTQSELEATYSTNADLKSLGVEGYEIIPEFNKNTLEYSLEVENDVNLINIIATKADNRSTVVGTGEKELVEGPNRIEIIVTAQKGNTKTYVLNVNVKELNPINIRVGDSDYKIIRKPDQLKNFNTFTATTITYEEEEIPALVNDVVNYTIVGARDESGNDHYFIYDGSGFKEYFELGVTNLIISPLEDDVKPSFEKYLKTTVTINGVDYTAYKLNDDSEFALIYGLNVENGEKGFYLYDLKNNTVQRYNEEEFNILNKDLKDYLGILVIFGVGLFLCLILIIVMLSAKSKKKRDKTKILPDEKIEKVEKKEKRKKDNKKKKNDDINEELEDTEEMYDLFKGD